MKSICAFLRIFIKPEFCRRARGALPYCCVKVPHAWGCEFHENGIRLPPVFRTRHAKVWNIGGIKRLRTIYYVRHGQCAGSVHRCLGNSDEKLDSAGLCQARRLARWAADRALCAVYTSPTPRCAETARILSAGRCPVFEKTELQEMDTGLWTGLDFERIRLQYPAEYAARGRHMGTFAPPGGESFAEAGARVGCCVSRLLAETDGTFVIVGHGGAGRGWLCGILGIPPDDVLTLRQPWGGVTVLESGQNGFSVRSLGLEPGNVPEDPEITALLDRAATPEAVRVHGRAVAKCAMALAEGQPGIDRELLRAACLLHDIARTESREHAAKGAALLDRAGWPKLADLVSRHHELGSEPSQEAKLLFLADKLTLGESEVTLETRFAHSREKCTDAQALAAWERRFNEAKEILYGLESKKR